MDLFTIDTKGSNNVEDDDVSVESGSEEDDGSEQGVIKRFSLI